MYERRNYQKGVGHPPNDSVNGNWNYSYDDFNRLATATNTSTSPNQVYQYLYDRFGNRWQQNYLQGPGSGSQIQLSFNSNNQITSAGHRYDAAGNLVMDNLNCYTYDAEGRLSSVAAQTAPASGVCGVTTMTYLYDPDGRRIAKLQGGAIVKQNYYDAEGQMVVEANASGVWQRVEVYAGDRHLATWASNATFFDHADWLGTERARTDANGTRCETITSLPFGDGEVTNGTCAPTPLFFTGLERDSESGLDHALFRLYNWGTGRWLSPDPINLTPERMVNPTNTLNKYIYAGNNPLLYVDHSGQDITIFYRAPGTGLENFGHMMLAITNQASGQVRFVDYYPATPSGNKPSLAEEAGGLHTVTSERMSDHAALTIRTTPELAQKLIDKVDEFAKDPGAYDFFTHNCAEVCGDFLKWAGLDVHWSGTPEGLWAQLYAKYSADPAAPIEALAGMYKYRPGKDFGAPMSVFPTGTNPFYNLQVLSAIADEQAKEEHVEGHFVALPKGTVCASDTFGNKTCSSD